MIYIFIDIEYIVVKHKNQESKTLNFWHKKRDRNKILYNNFVKTLIFDY